ncbi:E3 ubiquitin protein like [Actinidia chinensis var. chinensis]|uniref:E3 ubiquitin protein like n=1 Tax=Actinidia chinensis var. chinensis TaxID=1590841 RepID=A0A2R6P2V5_ACTCC|nr:E3 ubiquitin protein like [Actinidia chinensis var. chinensis]
MTMFPSQNISEHSLRDGYGCCGGSYGGGYGCGSCLGSDLAVGGPMAEDEARTESVNKAASSSKEGHDDSRHDQRWLQLGIGGWSHDTSKLDQADPRQPHKAGLVELDLFSSGMTTSSPLEFRPPRSMSNIASGSGCSNSFFLQQPGTSSTFPHHRRLDWAFRPIRQNIMVPSASSSSSSSSFSSYLGQPFQVHGGGVDVAGSSSDLRIIDPPRRPQSGIWFMLQASQNQSKEPFLPQIPKSFLRIKDGRMTVRLLMKYLVNKLRLDSESEIEITCRGQQLLPFLTLQHVRENIWSSRDDVTTLLSDSSTTTTTTNHIMLLYYARSA